MNSYSVSFWKAHKAVKCTPIETQINIGSEQSSNLYNFPTEYAMASEKFKLLVSNVSETIEEEIIINSEETNTLDNLEETGYVEEELKEDMELLELNDAEVSDSIFLKIKLDEQKSIVSTPKLASRNRRYSLRPQKRTETTDCDKFSSSRARKQCVSLPKNGSLETIFENPIVKNGALTLVGKNKLKRYLSFDNFVNKTKIRHRKLKLKRLLNGKGKKSNNKKVTIDDVKLKLKALEDDENEWMDVQE